jgi:hypothetical protein
VIPPHNTLAPAELKANSLLQKRYYFLDSDIDEATVALLVPQFQIRSQIQPTQAPFRPKILRWVRKLRIHTPGCLICVAYGCRFRDQPLLRLATVISL